MSVCRQNERSEADDDDDDDSDDEEMIDAAAAEDASSDKHSTDSSSDDDEEKESVICREVVELIVCLSLILLYFSSAHRLQSSCRPPVAVCYSRRSVICYCRPLTLEQSTVPADVRSASSLTTFRQRLKTYLFWQSYPDIVI